MSGLKRTLSTRTMKLSTRPSSHNAGVTLFEPDIDPASSQRSKRVKLEPKAEETALELEPIASPSAPGKKVVKSPRKPKPIQQALAVPHPAPPRWQDTYNTIKQMRSGIIAPVDTMGCEQAQFKEPDPKNRRFATLISLMLSSQTKDEVTDTAMSKLRTALGGSLSVDALIAADDATIAEAINKVGFWRRKTEYIKKAAQRLRDNFHSEVPQTVDELCSLPGVGPKMAFLTLQVAWKINVGIGVDVHVHRITNRLGWHKPPTKTPEETRLNLQSWLPTELHPDINHMLVGFGQMICLPVGPKCDQCDLSSMGLCPSAQKKVKSKSKARKTATVDEKAAASSRSLPKVEIVIETEDTKPILYTIADPPEVKAEEGW